MSKPQGVPVSVAKTAKDSPFSSSSGSSSFPIRAPITVDYDSSDNGFESDGFSDDEVMSDNSCEKPVVATPDDESSGDEEFVVSRTFVKNPDEKIGQEMTGSDVEENVVIKPYEKISEKNSSVDVGKYVVSRPFVLIPDRASTLNRVVSRRFVAVDGESLVSPLVEELDGKVVGGETKKVKVDGKVVGGDVILSLPSPSVPPIAKLSRDSDEDSVGSVFEEDDGISGVDKILAIETLKNLSAPKAQVIGGGEEDVDEYESQFNSVLKSEVFDGSVSLKLLTGVLGGDEERSGARKDSAKDNVLASLVNDELPHFPGDAKAICSVESSVSFSSDSSVLDEVADYSVEGIQGLENMEHVADLDETDSINSDHKSAVVGCISITQGETPVDYIESKQVAEGNQIENAGFNDIYISVDSSTVEVVKVVSSKVEIESDNCMTGLATKVVKSVGEKNVSDAQGETVHKPGGDIATECDIIYSVCEENAEADQNVNVDARSVYNLNCDGGHVNSSELFSGEINYKMADSIMKQETNFLNGQIASSDGGLMKDELCCKSTIYQPDSTDADLGHLEIENNIHVAHKLVQSKEEDKGSCSEGSVEELKVVEAIVVETVASELELVLSCDSFSGGESSHDHSKMVDEHFVTYSDKDAAVTFSDESEILSLPHSADLNSIISPIELTAQTNHPILSYSTDLDSKKTFPEDEKSKLALECIRLKYLSFVQRLGLSGEDPVVARVLYLLDRAIGRSSNLAFSQETAKRAALAFEAENKKGSDLDLSLNILIIGKSGVGKSATINSIFGEERTKIDPFEPATKAVKEILGTINGIKVRVLDTPGLKTSLKDEHLNWKVLKSIAKFTKRCPPDVVIYVDRLDMPSQDDLLLLRSITRSLGSIWHKTFIALTHAASTPPDGASGEPLSFEKFVAVQSQAIQQLISLAIDDQNMVNAGLVNPVCLVENQGYCEACKPLLLLCCSAKILSELNFTIGGAYETLDVNHLFDFIVPSPPLSYLSSLLQSNNHLELSADQGVENLNSEIEVENGLDFAGSSRAIISQVNAAYKTSFEVRFKESQHLVQQDQTTMIMLLKQQRGDFAWACNIQSQFSIRRNTKMAVHAVMNNKESGQVSVRVSISDHLQIALVVLLPIVRRIFRKFFSRLERDD